jgi:hypothetical protein
VVGRAAGNWGGESPGFAVHIVAVEVDPETGKTQTLRYTALQDPGTAVYPSYVESQMQGGAFKAWNGRSTKNAFSMTLARCRTPAIWTTACRSAPTSP